MKNKADEAQQTFLTFLFPYDDLHRHQRRHQAFLFFFFLFFFPSTPNTYNNDWTYTNTELMQRWSNLHKRWTVVATIEPATISTVTTSGEDQMGSMMKTKKKKKWTVAKAKWVLWLRKNKSAWDHQKKEKRIEGNEDQRKERKKKEKWRRKQLLRPSKAVLHVCCSDSGSLHVCLITKMPLKIENKMCCQFP